MRRLWIALDHKGRVATIVGFLFVVPANVKFVIDYFSGVFYSRPQLEMVIWANVFAIIWFILPSVVSFKGPKFEFEIKD